MSVGSLIPSLFSPVLSVTVNYTPAGGSLTPLDGVFFDAFSDPFDVENSTPSFICNAADVVGMADGDTLEHNSVTYRTAPPQPFAMGLMYIRLSET